MTEKEKRREYRLRYLEKNAERTKELKKKWYEENKEKMKEYRKEYYIKNKEKLKQQHKDYYEKNITKIKEKSKEWRLKNADYVKSTKGKSRPRWEKWSKENPEKRLLVTKKYTSKIINELHDTYVIQNIKKRFGNDFEVTPELIEAYRLKIRLWRELQHSRM